MAGQWRKHAGREERLWLGRDHEGPDRGRAEGVERLLRAGLRDLRRRCDEARPAVRLHLGVAARHLEDAVLRAGEERVARQRALWKHRNLHAAAGMVPPSSHPK